MNGAPRESAYLRTQVHSGLRTQVRPPWVHKLESLGHEERCMCEPPRRDWDIHIQTVLLEEQTHVKRQVNSDWGGVQPPKVYMVWNNQLDTEWVLGISWAGTMRTDKADLFTNKKANGTRRTVQWSSAVAERDWVQLRIKQRHDGI